MEFANTAIALILALLAGTLMLLTSEKTSFSILGDHTADTELLALSMRNNMIYVYTSEGGLTKYNTPGGDEYDIVVSGETVSATYAGTVIKKGHKPTVELYHNLPTVGKSITAKAFCIAKKYGEDCKAYVEVCAADDTACCKRSICGG